MKDLIEKRRTEQIRLAADDLKDIQKNGDWMLEGGYAYILADRVGRFYRRLIGISEDEHLQYRMKGGGETHETRKESGPVS